MRVAEMSDGRGRVYGGLGLRGVVLMLILSV